MQQHFKEVAFSLSLWLYAHLDTNVAQQCKRRRAYSTLMTRVS